MAPTGSESRALTDAARRRGSATHAPVTSNNSAESMGVDSDASETKRSLSTDGKEDDEHEEQDDEEEDDEDDRDDKSWRTRGESSPSLASALASPTRLLSDSLALPPPRSWRDATVSVESTRPERRTRALFWRNVVRQYNFVDQADERAMLLSLTEGIDWATMPLLPQAFMARHKEIYYLLCRADYERSSMIQRDVTRTFSVFERSQLPRRARDVDAQQRALFRVLNAVAEAEDGYCQGMNFIAAHFLVEGLDEADAYALFLYLLRTRQLARIYHHSSTFLDDYLVHFERMLQRELPDLYAHMQAQGFAIPMYGIEWFTTLFSLSTKPDLACAIFDLFFVGVPDIFLRMGLALLKLLEAPLMCMSFEDFLRDFKPLVRQLDPYHAVLQALAFRPNDTYVTRGEDTTAHIARLHYLRAAAQGNTVTTSNGDTVVRPPRAFLCHRSLPPELADAIEAGDMVQVMARWHAMMTQRESPLHALVLANEMLHFAVWHGRVAVAWCAIHECGADVDNADDTALTPLHFAVIRNQPELVRVLLCCGADPTVRGGRWSGGADSERGLTPFETAVHWKFCDTTAARLVLERDICLCCNTKFDAFAFHRETCRACQFSFCGRGPVPCIERHQCPAMARRWRRHSHQPSVGIPHEAGATSADDTNAVAEASTVSGDPTVELVDDTAREPLGSAPSSATSSSRRSSRSTSETSSSFVYINSPASALPTDRSSGRIMNSTTRTTTTDGAQRSTGLLGSLVGWFSELTSTVSSSHDDDDGEVLATAHWSRGIDFPDRPEWYCNARSCHAVFTFFSRSETCSRCSGYFCSDDFDAQRKQCRQCCSL